MKTPLSSETQTKTSIITNQDLKFILETIPEAAFVFNNEGIIVNTNSEMLAICGSEILEIVTNSISKFSFNSLSFADFLDTITKKTHVKNITATFENENKSFLSFNISAKSINACNDNCLYMAVVTSCSTTNTGKEKLDNHDYKSIFINTPSGVIYFDMNGKILHMNPSAAKIFDTTTTAFINRVFDEVFPQDFSEEISQMFGIAFGQKHKVTKIINTKISGIPYFFESTIVPAEESNTICGIILIMNDITEQIEIKKQFDYALTQKKESNKKLRAEAEQNQYLNNKLLVRNNSLLENRIQKDLLLNHISMQVVYVDLESRLQFVNRAVAEFLDKPNIKAKGMHIRDLYPSEYIPNIATDIRKVKTNNKSYDRGFKVKRSTQNEHEYLYVRYSPVVSANNELYGVLICIDNHTEEFNLREAQRAINERMKRTQCLAKLGSWEWVISNNKVYWSEELFNLLELPNTFEPIVYSTFIECVHRDDKKQFIDHVTKMFHTSEQQKFKHRVLLRNGKIKILETMITVESVGGSPSIVQCVSRDISEQESNEIRLKKREKQLNEAQEIAHIGSFDIDIESSKHIYSDQMFRIFDYHPDCGKKIGFLFRSHSLDYKQIRVEIMGVYKNPLLTYYEFNTQILTKNNVKKVVKIQLKCQRNGKQINRFSGIIHDITKSDSLEKKVRKNLITQKLISKVSFNLLNTSDLNSSIQAQAKDILEFLDAESLNIYCNTADRKFCQKQYSSDKNSTIENGLDYSRIPLILNHLKKDEIVDSTKFVHEKKYYEYFRDDKIVITPFFRNEEFMGVVMVKFLDSKKKIKEADEVFMRTFATMYASASTRISAENSIKRNEKKFRSLFDFANDIMLIISPLGELRDANQTAYNLLGFDKELLIGKNVSFFQPNSTEKIIRKKIEKVKDEKIYTHETVYRKVGGEQINIEERLRSIFFEGKPAILCNARDITERIEMEKKILNTIIETEENERLRFSVDVHDDIGPMLSLQKIYTKILADSNAERKADNFKKAIENLDETIRITKNIAYNLSPHMLENFGLKHAIESFCRKLMVSNINIIFESNLDELKFENKVEITIFRIIKELINNTIKHAKALNIAVSLHYKNDEKLLELIYTDDGIGFDFEEKVAKGKGIGLSNILGRIKPLNGSYSVLSKKGVKFDIGIIVRPIKSK